MRVATLNELLRSVVDALRDRQRTKPAPKPGPPKSRPAGRPAPQPPPPREESGYPGDFTGLPQLSYEPEDDRDADPGEVVWTWVPYEEDHSQGKDRPVLVVGRDGNWLLALPMTSQDHDRDARQEAREGRYWCDIGTGPWDREGRPSEVRVNRILRVDPDGIRRIAARLSEDRFVEVTREVLRHYR